MKKSIQVIIRIGCFMTILGLVFGFWNKIFKFKYGDGIYDMSTFYELEDNSVDVLILGSSHAFENFNTGTLWDEYGMSAFVLAGSIQPMWNTYYYLKEALKTQKPQLIVLEGYCTIFSEEFIDDSRIIKNNYGLRWSADKIESLKASAPKERWKDFFLEYTQYHTRYRELTEEDFFKYQGNPFFYDWKGFGCNMETTPLSYIDVSGVTERSSLYYKTEKYYRSIIGLAKENNIPIVVVISPYAGINEEEQKLLNKAGDIAEELEIQFLNCNILLDEIGIDYSTDAAEKNHLNYKGNQKYTKYIGRYLSKYYNIPNRKGNPKYVSWQRQADFIRQMIYDQELVETKNVDSLLKKILNKNYWIFVSLNGNCNISDKNVIECLDTLDIKDKTSSSIWFLEGERQMYSSNDSSDYYRSTFAHDFHLKESSNSDGTYSNSIFIDKEDYANVENGINIVVYDVLTEKIADSFGLDADDGYNLVR